MGVMGQVGMGVMGQGQAMESFLVLGYSFHSAISRASLKMEAGSKLTSWS